MGVGFIHSKTVHLKLQWIIPGIIPIDQLLFSVYLYQIVVETVGKLFASGVSTAGEYLAHEKAGSFIFQLNGHLTLKSGAFEGDHWLGMKIKVPPFST